MKKLLLEYDKVRIEPEDEILFAIWKSTCVDLKIAQLATACRLEATNFVPYPLVMILNR